jgi:hypothetical protein
MPYKVLWHHAQSTFVQACEKYCVERADPSWMKALNLVWGISLPSLPLPRAHNYILPPDPVRDGESTAPTSVVPPCAVDVDVAPFRSLGSAFPRALSESRVASTHSGIRSPFGLVDAPVDPYVNMAPSIGSSARRWLRLESEAEYSREGSDSVYSLPSLKESGLLPATSMSGHMAGQQQQPASSPATQCSTPHNRDNLHWPRVLH